MSHRSDTSEDDAINFDLSSEEDDDAYDDYLLEWYCLEFCIVKLKNDLNIFERRQLNSTVDDSSLSEDITGTVYFRYDKDILSEDEISKRAESEEKYPETHSKKYFFLPQKYIKEGNEAEVPELYTNLILRMKLEKPVTVVRVEPVDYKAVFKSDPNLLWFANEAKNTIFNRLTWVICMFSEKDQMDQFYAALAERNRDYFMNENLDYPSIFVEMIENAGHKHAKGDSFRYQHIEAFSAAFLHLLKTSNYISGKAQRTQRRAKQCIGGWINNTFNRHYDKNYSNCPEVFEELQANLFHLHLTRLVYKNYFNNRHNHKFKLYGHFLKPAYWNPSHFGWVICEVIEAKLSKKKTVYHSLEELFTRDIFQQPCFRRLLKDEQLRTNFGNFILDHYCSIDWDEQESCHCANCTKDRPEMETLFRGNYEDLNWVKFLKWSAFQFYVTKQFHYPYKGISVMNTIYFTTAVLAMYPKEKGERRKETAEHLLEYMKWHSLLEELGKRCIISEEKGTDHFKEMQKILATFFLLPDKRSNSPSDVSSKLPLIPKIYDLYCQSKKEGKEVNPSAGLLWLGIAHRQAIGSLGELSEEQQTNCLEMLESALNDLPLQTIETFFTSIQGFTTQKTSKIEEKMEKITDYIAQRKKEETAVLFLLNSEIGIQKVKVNGNMTRYEKKHTTSAGIFIFMTLFEYTNKIVKCTSRCSKKAVDYYVLIFTKYLINNTRVKDIFNKKNHLRDAVREHFKFYLKHYDTYEQLNDLLTLDWQTYYNKWVVEKPVIGKFDLNLIRDKEQIGYGGYGSAHICRYSEFMLPIVYKQFSDNSPFHSIVRELNSLMKVQSHPHVVRIFGVATDQLNVAQGLMMEYCEGGSLDKLIEKSDYAYDGKKAVHWMAQAASALIFFQKTGVVHLDIKPANMLLCKDHHYLKIADMGITLLAEIQDKIKYEPSNSQNDKFPVTTKKLGTDGFMAPEVMGSDKEKMVCSYASDIFSLGRTLWNIYYHKKHRWDEITVNRTVIMPVFLNPIFDAKDIPEDQTAQAVENITAEMEKTLEQGMPDNVKLQSRERKKEYIAELLIRYARAESKPDDVKLECPEKIAKWIIRMTRFDPDARPTAVILHKEFKKQYKEYKRMEAKATLQVTPSTKITFVRPIEVNRSVGIMLENTSNVEILQWSASSSNEKIAVVPAEGEIPPSKVVYVTLTCGEKSVVEENMGNFIVDYRIKMDTDEPEKVCPWASKHLRIVCNL